MCHVFSPSRAVLSAILRDEYFTSALACVASVSVRLRSKQRGKRVKDFSRVQNRKSRPSVFCLLRNQTQATSVVKLSSDRAWSLSFPETAHQQRSAMARARQVQFFPGFHINFRLKSVSLFFILQCFYRVKSVSLDRFCNIFTGSNQFPIIDLQCFLQGQISLPLSIENVLTGSNQSPFID